MRILYIDRSSWWAGAEACLAWLAEGMAARGHEVEIVVDFPLPHHERYRERGLKVLWRMSHLPLWTAERWRRAPRGLDRLGVVLRARTLKRDVARRRPDVVYFNLLRERARWDVAAVRAAGARVVGHLRQLRHQSMPSPAGFALCDHVIAISDAVAAQARDAGCAVPLTRIYDGLDPAQVTYDGRRVDAKIALGLPPDSLVLGFPASYEPRKGQDVALEAFDAVQATFPQAHLVFAGSTTTLSESGDYSARLQARAATSPAADRVHIGGRCDEVATFYAACDVVLALSRDGEAFGMVSAEAALAGRPVVATDAGATPEVVQHDQTGLLVPPNDADATAEALSELIENPQRREAMGALGQRHAALRFDSMHAIQQFESFYRTLRQCPKT